MKLVAEKCKLQIGIKNIGERKNPAKIESSCKTRFIGGARYLKLEVPLCVRETARRHRPYSKYCRAKADIEFLGR